MCAVNDSLIAYMILMYQLTKSTLKNLRKEWTKQKAAHDKYLITTQQKQQQQQQQQQDTPSTNTASEKPTQSS
jgi:hypothetical protein